MTRRLRSEIQQKRPFTSLEEETYVELLQTTQAAGWWVSEALKPFGLTPSQFNVLRILRGARPEALASCRISERMVNRDPDITRLLDRLEKAGLVEKARDTADRRVVNVRITAAGLERVERATRANRERLREKLGKLSRQQLETLCDLLELVRAGGA